MKKTIYDVAKAMNLSPSTISKILHNNSNASQTTKERVLQYVQEIGYVADTNARILKSKRSWTIGVIFSDISLIGLEHPFFASIIQHFKNYVERQGYEIVFIVSKLGNNELTYLQWCKNKKVDGVLIVTGNINNEMIIELVNSNIPCVSTDIIMPHLNSVLSNDFEGIELCINFAIQKGLTKIACITGPLTSRAFSERLRAYDQIMNERKIPLRPHYYQEAESYGFNGGYQATMKLIEQVEEIPEIILSFSDDLAFGVIRALEEKGYRVPEDISVIGFDDITFAKHFTPSLSTIRQDRVCIAETAAKLLLQKMQQDEDQDEVVHMIPVELVLRGSTK